MKKITLLLALLIFSIGYSQTYDLLESFNGTGLEGTFGDTTAEYATDPDGSDQVVKITSNTAGAAWQGVDIVLTSNYKLTTDTQLTMQLEVYSTTAITIAPKAQGGLSGAPDSVTSVDHTGSGWENLTLTFDKSLDGKVPANGIYADFALHINWDTANNNFGASDGRVFYIKNLKGLLSENTGSDTANVVTVDANATWKGYMNVFDTSGGYLFGSAWGLPDLKTSFDDNNLVLQPNFSGYSNALSGSDGDRAYWTNSSDGGVTPGPTGNKIMDASSYVEPGTTFNGKDLTFTGTINANSIATGYTAKVFIKALDPNNGYADALNGSKIIDLPSSGSFTLSATAAELPVGLVIQYGFTINGLNANPADESALGSIIIAPNTLSTASVTRTLVNAYPNPTRNNWTISTGDATATSIEVFNLLGKKIISKKSTSKTTSIDASGLSSGIYLAIIKTSEGSSSLKLIKE